MNNPTGRGSGSHQEVHLHLKTAMSIRRFFLKLNPKLCLGPGVDLRDFPKGKVPAIPNPLPSFTPILIQVEPPQFLQLFNT